MKIIDIKPLSGFAVTFMLMDLYIVKGNFEKNFIKNIGIIRLYTNIMQRFGHFLNKTGNYKDWPWMYTMVAKK